MMKICCTVAHRVPSSFLRALTVSALSLSAASGMAAAAMMDSALDRSNSPPITGAPVIRSNVAAQSDTRHVLQLHDGYSLVELRGSLSVVVRDDASGEEQVIGLSEEAVSIQPLFAEVGDPALGASLGLNRFFVVEWKTPQSDAVSGSIQAEYSNLVAHFRMSGQITACSQVDPLRPQQWHLDNFSQVFSMYRNPGNGIGGVPGADIGANEASLVSTGSPSTWIAVLDSGVLANHPDLESQIVRRRSFVPNENINSADDDTGHGTHVAGIIAAITSNGQGGSSAAHSCKLAIGRVFSGGVGSSASVAQGIMWAADIPEVRVINMSLGAANYAGDPSTNAAIEYANSRGKVLVAAAGNSQAFFSDVGYPARHPKVLAVGSTDVRDRISYFSDAGPSLTLAAPGEFILSTGIGTNGGPGYRVYSGTSMASPQVAAAAAVLSAQDPALTPQQIGEILKTRAADRGPLGRDNYFGSGRISLSNALGRSPKCLADFDRDGTLSMFDYLDFVNCFATDGCNGTADINRDGEVDIFDYLDFVSRFVLGCQLEAPQQLLLANAQPDDDEDFIIEPLVLISWLETNVRVEGYRVYYSTDPQRSQWTLASILPGSTSGVMSTATPSGLPYGASFALKLESFLGDDVSPLSTAIEVRNLDTPAPVPPTNVTSSQQTNSDLLVSWSGSYPAGTNFLVRWWPDVSLPSNLELQAGYFLDQRTIVSTPNAIFPAAEIHNALREFGFGGSSSVPINIRVVPFTRWDRTNLMGGVFAPPCDKVSRSAISNVTIAGCLNAPTNLRISFVDATEICTQWTDNSTCELGYEFEFSRWTGSEWTAWEGGISGPNLTEICYPELPPETTYRFRVRAFDSRDSSAWSAIVQGTTGAACLQPPASFRVSQVAGNQVCFLWQDNSSCETQFRIEQSVWNGSSWSGWTLGENVPANRGDACRTGLAYSTLYRFRVRAEDGTRISAWSSGSEATTGADCIQVPTSLRVTSTGCGSVSLAWNDTSSCETRFVIEQSRWSGSTWGSWVHGENVPANRGAAVRDGQGTNPIVADGIYKFRIRAEIEGQRVSAWSNETAQATATPTCLRAPSNLRAGTVTRTSVQLLWSDNSSCETQQQIEQQRLQSNGSWTSWGPGENVPADRESAVRDGLSANTTYRFRVLADQGSCESPWSNVVEVRTAR